MKHEEILLLIGWKTVILTASAVCVLVLLWFFVPRSPYLHRFVWGMVLILGLIGGGVILPVQVTKHEPNYLPRQNETYENNDAALVNTNKENTDSENMASIEAAPAETILPDINPANTHVASDYTPEYYAENNIANNPASREITVDTAGPATLSNTENETGWISFSRLLEYMFYVWLIGITALFTRKLVLRLLLRKTVAGAKLVSGEFEEEWHELLAFKKIPRHKVRLCITNGIGPGMTGNMFGTKAVIVVPRDLWEEATPEIRRGILQHELAHYENRDLLRIAVARFIVYLHWFNPVAWRVLRKLEETTEWLCDLAGFGTTDGTLHFAETMVAVHETTPSIVIKRMFSGNEHASGKMERRLHYLKF
ncbi:MAG: M56 family metallopeptidase, partial [Thermoguttaceae bacterium]